MTNPMPNFESLDTDILNGIFGADGRRPLNHVQLWEELTADDASLIRRGLVRAAESRSMGADAGDAYLEGMVVALSFQHRKLFSAALLTEIAGIEEQSTGQHTPGALESSLSVEDIASTVTDAS